MKRAAWALPLAALIALSGCKTSSPEALWEAYVDRSKAKIAQNRWNEADELIQLALKQTDKCASKDTKLIETLRLQARIYKEQNRFEEGAKVCRDWFGLTTKLYGPRNSQTNESQAWLTDMLIELAENDQAEELLKNSIKTITDKYGEDDLYIAEPLRSLGNTYSAKGFHSKGEAVIRKALAIQKEHLDETDEQMIQTYRDLAHCLELQRKRESYDILVKQLAVCEKTGSPQLFSVLFELADDEIELMGMFHSALEHLDRVFKERQHLTSYERNVLNLEKARIYHLRGELEKANTLYQNVFEDCQKNQIQDKIMEARIKGQVYKGLANISFEKGDLKTAANELRMAEPYEWRLKRKEDMPQIFNSFCTLAEVYCGLKETTAEEDACNRLFYFFVSHQLDNKELYFEQAVRDQAYERIAHYAQAHANFEWGKARFEDALKKVEKQNGKNSRQAALWNFFLGRLCQRFANDGKRDRWRLWSEGEVYLANAIRIMEMHHDDSCEYWDAVRRYGQCQHGIAKFSQAEACYRRLLESRKLPQERLIEAQKQLAEVLNLQGKIQEAKAVASSPVPVSVSPPFQFYLQPDEPLK